MEFFTVLMAGVAMTPFTHPEAHWFAHVAAWTLWAVTTFFTGALVYQISNTLARIFKK